MTNNADRHVTDDHWHRIGPYQFAHTSGWTITNRIIRRRPVWTLQLGKRSEGAFLSPADAMKRHAEITGVRGIVALGPDD
ncbi:hypothetical protein [Burkholderia vietnamiensis]|uniref:hypothetical protein n=1 Tax=Burkholderia vietnamiensis TaxID=60552 RepID=UPI000A6916FD|nr:hypothetical protein [Burkholderia vietnamiensis]